MRGMLIALVAGALLVASFPLATQAEAREGALATPRFVDRSPDGSQLIEWRGESALAVKGACIPAPRTCFGSEETEDGRFLLASGGTAGRIVIRWTPVNESLRELRVHVGSIEVEGPSPIEIELTGLVAGEYAVGARPAGVIVGAYDQTIEWTATFHVGLPADDLQLHGWSSYQTLTGCVLILCEDHVNYVSDAIIVPWRAEGKLVAEWDPRDGPARIAVPGTDFFAEGETPLVLDLSGLEAGEWRVELRPMDLAAPLEERTIAWTVELTPSA